MSQFWLRHQKPVQSVPSTPPARRVMQGPRRGWHLLRHPWQPHCNSAEAGVGLRARVSVEGGWSAVHPAPILSASALAPALGLSVGPHGGDPESCPGPPHRGGCEDYEAAERCAWDVTRVAVSGAALMSYRKLSGFKQQELIISQLWRLEVQHRGSRRAPEKGVEKGPSWPLVASGGSWPTWCFLAQSCLPPPSAPSIWPSSRGVSHFLSLQLRHHPRRVRPRGT